MTQNLDPHATPSTLPPLVLDPLDHSQTHGPQDAVSDAPAMGSPLLLQRLLAVPLLDAQSTPNPLTTGAMAAYKPVSRRQLLDPTHLPSPWSLEDE